MTGTTSNLKRFSVLFLIFCAAVSAAQNFNVSPNLKKHVEYLSSPALQGRAAGSQGEHAAARYVHEQLSSAGLVMLTDENGQDFTINEDSGALSSLNVVGVLEGFDPQLREEYIVVGAHIDGLGTNMMTVDGRKVEQLYPGADSNASGVAALIELARQASQCSYLFPRSIVFVAFGAGEKGVAGSWYFVNRAFGPIGKVRAMIDLNTLGHMSKRNPFQLLTQVSATDVNHMLELTKSEPVVTEPQIAKSLAFSSDYLPFYEKSIPVFCFSTGTTKDSRTVRDTPDDISYSGLEMACNYMFYFTKCLACCGDDMPSMEDKKIMVQRQEKDASIHSVSECDRRPQFFHSDERHFLEAWVYKYLKYPPEAIRDGIQGTVLVSFIVEKNGEVTDVRIERGVDELLDEEALKVVRVSPKWSAGQIHGVKVRTRITIPVEFRLTDSKSFKLKIKR